MKSENHNQQLYLKTNTEYFIGLCVDEFLKAKRLTIKPRSLKNYAQKMRAFNVFCEMQSVYVVTEITPGLIRDFLGMLQATGHNEGGVHGFYRPVQTFLNWVELEYDYDLRDWRNPIDKVRIPTPAEVPLPPITPAEVLRLVEVCDGAYTGSRDRAIFLSLFDTGVRAFEFCAMDLHQVDMITGAVFVPVGKGDRSRTVFLSRQTRKLVRAYLHVRKDRNSPALWQTDEGDRLTYWGLREILRRRSEQAGVFGRSLHDFRRGFCLECLRNGMDLITLQRLSGHTNLNTLRRYLAQVTHDLQISHAAHNPVDGLRNIYE